MKFSLSLALLVSQGSAFAPSRPFVTKQQAVTFSPLAANLDEMSLDEEVDALVQEELGKTKRASNLRNQNGVSYAPWMNMDEVDEAKIRVIMKEKAEARRRRQEQERNVKGALLRDSQAQELAGTGLRFKVLNGNDIELEWATSSEANTKGFILKRRAAKTDSFEVIASYENYGPLASKGVEGGVYRYLDEGLAPGGYVYRVTECEANGDENDLSQCLVELQTEEEQRGAVVAVAVAVSVAIAAVVAGTLLDPVQY